MSNRSTIAALAMLVILAGCALLGSWAAWATDSATDRATALATEATTATEAHAVSVCVGLINIGSCRTEQEQTGTPTQTERRDAGGNPWPVIVLSTVMLLIAQYLVINAADPWGARGRQ